MPALFSADCIGSVLFSAIGFVAFAYGKRMHYWTPMLCGLGLMLLPLFLANLTLMITSVVLGATAVIFRHS